MRAVLPLLVGLLLPIVPVHAQDPAPAPLADLQRAAHDADYRADADALARVRTSLEPHLTGPDVQPMARYYAAFVDWRLTIMTRDRARFDAALAQLRALLAERPDDVEGRVLLAALAPLGFAVQHPDSPTLITEGRALLEAARRDAPDNPRGWIVHANSLVNRPATSGGSLGLGIHAFHEAIHRFIRRPDPADGEPRWGYPEAHAWLGDAHMRAAPPEAWRAKEAYERALELRPDYWWARERGLPRAKAALEGQKP